MYVTRKQTLSQPGSSEFLMSCFHSVTDESTTDAFSFTLSEDMSQLTCHEIMKFKSECRMVITTTQYLNSKWG